MAESQNTKNWTMGTIAVVTGGGSPVTYTVAVEAGDLSLSNLKPDQKDLITVEDRGQFSTLINGKQAYVAFSFSARMRDLVDPTDQTLVGILLKKGAFASSTGTLGANKPWTVDIIWTVADAGDPSSHVVTLEDCRVEDVQIGEGETNEISISGTCFGTVSMT